MSDYCPHCDYQICAYDTEEWPCLTIRALEEGS